MERRAFAITPAIGIAFVAGVLIVQQFPGLPHPAWSALLVAIALTGLAFTRWRWLAWPLLGIGWAALRGQWALDDRLPVELEGSDVDVVGRIVDLPQRRDDAWRFLLDVESARLAGKQAGETVGLTGLVRVAWHGDALPTITACERLQLRLRVKRPRGMVNPMGFDSERYALQRGINATAYVRGSSGQRVATPSCIDRWRERIAAGIDARVADPHDAALLRALAVGDTRGLAPDDWDVARANGVTHLLSISGFHVGVAGLAGALLLRLVWWLWPALALRCAAPVAAALGATLVAALYGLLAGASLPTLRTVLMIVVFALMRSTRRAGSGAQSLTIAALVLLVIDPLSVLAPGFWLSFVGVAFLMLGLQRPRRIVDHLRALGSAQLVMTISLLPLTLWFFGEVSLLGALANLVAVPLVSLAIVPLALLSALLLLVAAPLATPFLVVSGWLVHAQWWLWASMAGWPGARWYLPEPSLAALLLAMAGALWLFLPRGLPLRLFAPLLLLPLLWPPSTRPPAGAFDARFIDVGQGLSVLVRTQHHALLYDAGAKFPSGFDVGAVAVVPTLHAVGVRSLDVAIVSHADNDHAGGMAAVLRSWPDVTRIGGEPQRGDIDVEPCSDGREWSWDGVRIRLLRPAMQDGAARDGNDRSCLVLVEGQGARLLLTGDASSAVEDRLVTMMDRDDPRPLLLSVGHHGSRRSSSRAFIHGLQPRIAVVSAGWRSRFGHPHPLVVQRFADAGVALLNTADAGAITIVAGVDGSLNVIRERERQRRYWRE